MQLLYNRGLVTLAEAEAFFQPRYERTSSPFALSGMADAVRRVLRAVRDGEKLAVYADYDADAVTACAVLYRTLKQFGAAVDTYIPDRFSEGYGVNIDAVKQLAESGIKLIVTVDCGINAVAETALAKSLGVDVVVTDHHEIVSELPDASAVVNPKLDPKLTELSGLTGVGVAFKLAAALFSAVYPQDYAALYGWDIPEAAKKAGAEVGGALKVPPGWEKWFLDLVCIGTVADCQSLLGENRTLVKYGLKVLSKTKWPGLRQLMRNAGLPENKDFDTFDIGFILAPRINAAGRIQHADIAFRLLTSDDPAEISMYAGQLESLNAHRQRLTEQITAEARALVLEQGVGKLLFAVGENWPKGVVGLVASRLAEEFSRPAVVLERGEAYATGSARSIGNFDIVRAFASAGGYLERFGGHQQAAGVTLKNERIEDFRRTLLDFAAKHLKEDDLVRSLDIDAVLEPQQVTHEFVEKLGAFEPFGPGNWPVNFLFSGLVVEQLKTVGSTGKHLKLHASSAGKILEFIGFNHAYRVESLRPGDRVDIVAEPSHNHWNGLRRIQLKIKDILNKSA